MKTKQFYFFKKLLDDIPAYADKYLNLAIGAWKMNRITRKQLFDYLKDNDETLKGGQ